MSNNQQAWRKSAADNANVRRGFLDDIASGGDVENTILIFADWLEDQGDGMADDWRSLVEDAPLYVTHHREYIRDPNGDGNYESDFFSREPDGSMSLMQFVSLIAGDDFGYGYEGYDGWSTPERTNEMTGEGYVDYVQVFWGNRRGMLPTEIDDVIRRLTR